MSTRSQRGTICFFLFVLLVSAAPLNAVEPTTTIEFTPAETEFIALAEEFRGKLHDFWKHADTLTDEHERDVYYDQYDPAIEYLPKLLAFEREHTGEDVGLDALSEVTSYASGGGDTQSPGFKARREVLTRMKPYEDRPLATMVVVRLKYAHYDPRILDYLRRLADAPDADPTLRAIARFELADKLLSLRTESQKSVDRLQDFDAGMPTLHSQEPNYYREFLASLPPEDELAACRNDAIAALESLAATGDKYRLPAYRALDPTGHLVRIDAEKSKSALPLSTKAAAVLFQERNLRPGQPAPALELQLIDGRPWSLSDQRGRVTVIQFSFTGCGPCEEMYPKLRESAEQFGERVSIVTILRDETPEHAFESAKSGKITWPIACDGNPGEFCTRWAVSSFPTVYVLDATGRISAVNLRDTQLQWRIAKLVAADE